MSIEAIARGGGLYRTFVLGVKQSGHTQVHKAIQRASELIEEGADVVRIDHDYRLDVFDTALPAGIPEDDADDGLADDITAIVTMGKTVDGKETRLYIRGMTPKQRIQYGIEHACESSRSRKIGTWITTELRGKRRHIGFAWRGAYVIWNRATFRILLDDPT